MTFFIVMAAVIGFFATGSLAIVTNDIDRACLLKTLWTEAAGTDNAPSGTASPVFDSVIMDTDVKVVFGRNIFVVFNDAGDIESADWYDTYNFPVALRDVVEHARIVCLRRIIAKDTVLPVARYAAPSWMEEYQTYIEDTGQLKKIMCTPMSTELPCRILDSAGVLPMGMPMTTVLLFITPVIFVGCFCIYGIFWALGALKNMACPAGVHCTTGPDTWIFADEEPPYSLGWFTAAFAAVLYTRTPTATIAFVLLSQVAIEFGHVIRAWFMTGGGPLDPNPGGLFGLFFGAHASVESLLITYPLFSVLGAMLGYLLVVGWGTPIYLQSYFEISDRAKETGRTLWYLRQVKYSFQLILVAYFPHWISFGIVAGTIGVDKKVELLAIWMLCNLFLLLLFWWWNQDELDVIWKKRRKVSARVRHNRFYIVWAAVYILMWAPVIVLAGTEIPSQFRAAIGIAIVFVVLSPQLPKLLDGKAKEGVESL